MTGSRARIIIFTFENLSLRTAVLDGCGVEFVIQEKTKELCDCPEKRRWEWYHSFLKVHKGEFDRVFHSDSRDAFFFGDPFNFATDPNGLYFVSEDRPIRECFSNNRWITMCHRDADERGIREKTILCSGTLFGNVTRFVQFIEIMITHKDWLECWARNVDQGHLNYIFYTRFENDTNVHIMGCNSGFLTTTHCSRSGEKFQGEELMVPNGERRVTYVHQYDRYQLTYRYVKGLCKVEI
jgi:hypothetical protein